MRKIWRKWQGILAIMLCLCIVWTSSGVNVLADDEPSTTKTQEEVPTTDTTSKEEESEPIEQAPEVSEPFVYWNTGETGNDEADGKSAATPVSTLNKAIETAKIIAQKTNQEVMIYAMNPYTISEDLIIDAQGMTISKWLGWTDQSQSIFELQTGSLTLSNVVIAGTTENNVMSIGSGTLKVKDNVLIEGKISLNYDDTKRDITTPVIELFALPKNEAPFHIEIQNEAMMAQSSLMQVDGSLALMGESILKYVSLTAASLESWKLSLVATSPLETDNSAQSKTVYLQPTKEEVVQAPLTVDTPRAASTGYIYWHPDKNPVTAGPEDGHITIPGGSDTIYDGSSSNFPVLTFKKAKELAINEKKTIICMTNITIGDAEDAGLIGDDIVLDGEGISIQQWDANPEELFLVGEGKKLTLKNINLLAADGYAQSTILRITKGQLNIDSAVHVTGEIQTELSAFTTDVASPIHLITDISNIPADAQYHLYYSDINGNLTNQGVNTVIPLNPTDAADQRLMTYFILSKRNTDENWNFRFQIIDGQEGNDQAGSNILELHRNYTYTAIYVNGETGNDSYFGGNCLFPVKTFAKAKELLEKNMSNADGLVEGVIKVCGTITVADQQSWNLTNNSTYTYSDKTYIEQCAICEHSEAEGISLGHTTVPQNLIKVADGGELTTQDIRLYYSQDNDSGSNILVNAGGTYHANTGTIISGGSKITAGIGIEALGAQNKNAVVEISDATIQSRHFGIKANYTMLTMNTGNITNNNVSGILLDNASTFNLIGGTIYENGATNSNAGGGINANKSTINMSGGAIQKNKAYYNGGGIYSIATIVNISGGEIRENKTLYNSNSASNGGGGLYIGANSQFTLSGNGKINNNETSSSGGGIYYNGSSFLIKDNGEVSNNIARYHAGGIYAINSIAIDYAVIKNNSTIDSSSLNAGGIYMSTNAELVMKGGIVEENNSSNVGGIFVQNGSATISNTSISKNIGGGILLKDTNKESSLTNCQINENIASTSTSTSNNGGGIRFSYDYYGALTAKTLTVENTSVNNNESKMSGGGIYCNWGNLVLAGSTEVKNNTTSKDGGGIFIQGKLTATNQEISNNKAEQNGGGIAHSYSTTSYRYENLARLDGTVVKNNTAVLDGGGIYHTSGTLTVTGAAEIKDNQASGRGSTFYLSSGVSLLNAQEIGHGTVSSAGTDGIYIDIPTGSSQKIYMNPEMLNLTDSIYMNTATSRIYLLADVTDVANSLPVSVNKDVFSTGSIIATPVKEIVLDGTTYKYSDASMRSDYFTGGRIPDRLVLGGFKTNIVLVGEGVYLDGITGDDSRDGSTPVKAVKTYEKALELLEQYITEAKAQGKSFTPYIYICGTVNIINTATWTLNETDYPWLQQIDAPGQPQVIRFGSFYETMVAVGSGGNLTLQNILVNGNKDAVDGANNTIESILNVNSRGNLTVTDGGVVAQNYSANVYVNGGQLLVTGNNTGGEIKNSRSYGVHALNGGQVRFNQKGHIKIDIADENSTRTGLYITGASTAAIMEDDSYIERTVAGTFTTSSACAYVQSKGTFTMQGNARILDNDGYAVSNFDGTVVMQGNAEIVKPVKLGYGYYSTNGGIIEMKDNAKISNGLHGIHFDTNKNSATISGQAIIENSEIGIALESNYSSLLNSQVTIKDQAQLIAGVNGKNGISDKSTGSVITLSGAATIQGYSDSGIQIICAENEVLKGSLTISENAVVKDNKENGIIVSKYRSSGGTTYSPPYTLNITDQAMITNNQKRGINVDSNVTTYLTGTPQIVNNASQLTDIDFGKSIHSAGILYMDGTAVIDDEIYLADTAGNNHIILTKAIPQGIQFSLGYLATYIDKIVVEPGGEVSDATIYFDSFKTVNIPNDRGIYKDKPNIVVQTENNVYLAGDGTGNGVAGDDRNNGVSPTSPVRTFKRAKEVLATLAEGANIYICNYPVVITSDDNIWSLEEGKISNGESSWVPTLLRYDNFKGTMFTLTTGMSDSLTLENLVIDGNNGKVQADSPMFSTNLLGAKLTIKNSVIQNHTVSPSSISSDSSGNSAILLYSTGNNAEINIENTRMINNSSPRVVSLIHQTNATTHMSFKNSEIRNNAINTKEESGGGIATIDTKGNLDISDTKIEENSVFAYSDINTSILRFTGNILNVSGNTTVSNNSIRSRNNYGHARGAFYIGGGTAVVNGINVENNTTEDTLYSQKGSGIYFEGEKLTLIGATISNNTAKTVRGSSCGALYQEKGIINLENGTISNNVSKSLYGGGFYQNSGTAFINGTAFTNNTASIGGGIYSLGKVTIANATITGNVASSGMGGGIYVSTNSELQLNSANINYNVAQNSGGGLYIGTNGSVRMNGGTFTANQSNRGAAIYYTGKSLNIEGGAINGNLAYTPGNKVRDSGAPVSISAQNFQLKGGNAVISDYIYLSNINNIITLSGSIYQKGRIYNVDLASDFIQGSTVVKPDGNVITNAAQYHKYFAVSKVGYVLDKANPNLVLKQAVFIDSINGKDTNRGETPNSAVKTFAKASSINSGKNLAIYVSGPIQVTSNQNWSLDPTSNVYRYAGFALTGVSYPAYDGPMVEIKSGKTLTLSNISIYGRRDIDSEKQTDTMFKVENGASLTIADGTNLSKNNAENGGAIQVDEEGTTNISGGRIEETFASSKGGAIYLQGILNLSKTPYIASDVFLEGAGLVDNTSSYINATTDYAPKDGGKLNVTMRNPYATRHVVHYPDGYVPTREDIEKYTLETNVMALFDLDKRTSKTSILELKEKGVVYIDGINGNDANDGESPKYAVKTLQAAYEKLRVQSVVPDGGLIIVVNTVNINNSIKLINETISGIDYATYDDGMNKVDAGGAVSFRRYAQPIKYNEIPNHYGDFDIGSFAGTLFNIEAGGQFTLGNIMVDGHKNGVIGRVQMEANGVESQKALFTVNTGGTLSTTSGTVFTNNKNIATDGRGGAIENAGGICDLEGAHIYDNEASKGSAVYQDGQLKLSRQPRLEGEFYLTGQGNINDASTSKYIEVKLLGFKPQGQLDIRLEDAYNGRPVIKYPDGTGDTIGISDIAIYQLEQSVLNLFSLNKRQADKSVLELQLRNAVYIDGIKGLDTNDGATPDTSVKTLERAYEIVKSLNGGAIYVVDTVTILSDISLTNTSYTLEGNTINVIGGQTEIRRYVQPDKANDYAGYTHATNLDTLFVVADGVTFTLQDIVIDGHKDPRTNADLLPQLKVSTSTQATSPLISVGNSYLILNENTVLQNNNNATGEGGAVKNHGIMHCDGVTIQGNMASKGSGIYQGGDLTFASNIVGMEGQELYLVTQNTGTTEAPIWGADSHFHVQEILTADVGLDINMDHAVRGREVAVFDLVDTIDDSQKDSLILGNTVPVNLPLVTSKDISNVLELYDYTPVTVSNIWEDMNDIDGYRQSSLQVQLYYQGNTVGTPITLDATNNWTQTVQAIKYDDTYTLAREYTMEIVTLPDHYEATYAYDYKDQTNKLAMTLAYTPKRTITYDTNSADASNPPTDTSSPYTYGTNITILDNPEEMVKTGYQFAGWNTNANGTGQTLQPQSTFTLNDNTTLYAMWLKADKESVEEVEDGVLRPGEKLSYTISLKIPYATRTLSIVDQLPEGTTFVSADQGGSFSDGKVTWNFDNVAAGTEYTLHLTVSVNKDQIANKEIKNQAIIKLGENSYSSTQTTDTVGTTYRVTYDGNTASLGTVPIDDNFYILNQVASVVGNTGDLKKENSLFDGWNTKADGTGTHYKASDTIAMTSNTTLYAMWITAEKTSSQEVDDNTLKPGEKLHYEIKVTIPQGASSVTVKDPLPNGVHYIANSATNGGVLTGNTMTWTLNNLPSKSTLILGFDVMVDVNASVGTKYLNKAEVEIDTKFLDSNTVTDEVGTTYKLTYKANGGTGFVPVDNQLYAKNEEAKAALNIGDGTAGTELTNGNLQFAGWNTKADGTGIHINAGSTFLILDNTILYAVWLGTDKTSSEENTTDILRPKEKLNYEIKVTIPEASAKVIVIDEIPVGTHYVADSANANGKYSEENRTITWELQDKAVNETVVLTFAVIVDEQKFGKEIKNTANIIYQEETYQTPSTTDTIGQTFKVTYDGNGNEVGSPPIDTYYYVSGEQVNVLGNVGHTLMRTNSPMEVTNGHFLGWNTKADGTGTHYNPNDTFNIEADTTLYAMWLTSDKSSIKADINDALYEGKELSYEIQIKVPEASTKLSVTDKIPDGTTYVLDTANLNAIFNENKLTWELQDLKAGEVVTLKFKVQIGQPTTDMTITNQAIVSVGENEYKTNSVIDQISMDSGSTDVSVIKDSYKDGDVITYTFTISNHTDSLSKGIFIRDYIPQYTDLIETDKEAITGIFNNQKYVSWYIEPLQAGIEKTVQFKVRIQANTPQEAMIKNIGLYDLVDQKPELTDTKDPTTNTNQVENRVWQTTPSTNDSTTIGYYLFSLAVSSCAGIYLWTKKKKRIRY